MIFKNYEFRVEPVQQAERELRVLHEQHHHETEAKYLDHPLAVDYDALSQMEAVKRFILYTAREKDTGQLVGVIMMFLSRSLHIQANMAIEDEFFVTKLHRGAGLARALLDFAEMDLKMLRDVNYILMSSKHPVGGPNLGPFFEVHGYIPMAAVFSKNLHGKER